MRRVLLLFSFIFVSGILLIGCPSSNSPSSPSSTATPTGTLPTSTSTFTRTETPLCGSPLSFGKNFIGATNSVFSFPNIFTVKYDLPIDGKVLRLHAHVSSLPTPVTNLRMALYTDNGGAPQSLLSESTPKTAVVGWNTLEIPDTVTLAAGTYWIALSANNNTGLSFDNGTSGDSQTFGAAFGPFPDPLAGGSPSDWGFSFYADYCAQPGSHTPTRTPTWSPTPTITRTHTPTRTETPLCGTSYSFGKNFPSGSNGDFNTSFVFGSRFDLPVAGVVTKLNAYIASTGGSIRMALYDDAAGTPTTLITQSAPKAALTGWNVLEVPNTAELPAKTYWIFLTPDSPVDLSYDLTGNIGDGYGGSMGFGGFPSNFPGTGPNEWGFSFYADYCVNPTSPTPLPTVTWTFTPTVTLTSTRTPTETPAPSCQGNYFMGQNFVPAQATPQEFNIHFGNIFAMPATLTVTGRVKTLHCITNSAVGGTNLQMALYTNSGGNPGTKIEESNGQAAVSGLNNFDIPDTAPLSPGIYWVVLAGSGPVTLSTFYNDTSAVGKWFNGGYGNFPSPASGVGSPIYDYSFYAGFCVDVSSPTPEPTITFSPTPTFTHTPTVTRTETPIPGCTPGVFGINAVQTPCSCGFNYFHASKYTLAVARRIVGLNLYSVTAGQVFQMAVYDDLGGNPNNRLTISNPQVTTIGWNTVPIPGTAVLTAGTYWIAKVGDNMALGYNGGTGTDTSYSTSATTLSNPAPGGGGLGSNLYSFYADTCP